MTTWRDREEQALNIPRREIRAVTWTLLSDINRLIHRAFFPDMPFHETGDLTLIVLAILRMHLADTPLTIVGLAQEMQMPRSTLYARLDVLEARGIIEQGDIRPVRFNMAKLSDEPLRELVEMIHHAAARLPRTDTVEFGHSPSHR
jgi:predicted transcriptional regulator